MDNPSIQIVSDTPAVINPGRVYIMSLASAESRRVMKHGLKTVASILLSCDPSEIDDLTLFQLGWSQLHYEHTQAVRAQLLQTGLKASSINRVLAALRGVLKESWRLGEITAEQYQRAVDIRNVKGDTVPAGRSVSFDEIKAIVDACLRDERPGVGARDAAIMAVLYAAGLRRAEISGLDFENYVGNCDEGDGRIRVLGKGNKERDVFIAGTAKQALDRWVVFRGDEAGAMFLPSSPNGIILHTRSNGSEARITPQTVYSILLRRAAEAGVDNITPHDMRRTMAGDMLDNGIDLATVQKFMGHSSPTTTSNYDRRGDKAKQNAAVSMDFPYPDNKKEQYDE